MRRQNSKSIHALAICTIFSKHLSFVISDLRCLQEIWSGPGVDDDEHFSLLETYDSNLLYIFVDMLIAKKGSRADAGKYLITTVIHLSCGLTLAAAKVAPSFNPVFCAPFRPRNIITHISSLFPPCLSLVLDSLTPVLAGCNSSLSIPRYFIEYSLYACTLSFKF